MKSKLSIIALFFLVMPSLFAASDFVPEAPAISAKSYVLMDVNSGQILASYNENKKLPPASLTKMMTGYIIEHELEEGNIALEDQVIVTTNSWAKNFPGSSKMFIEPGKDVTVEQIRKGIIVQSGNDASVAIAEHIAGSEDSFAQLMNHHAKLLGLTGTNFVNSMGLPHAEHYTTAMDMAFLASAVIKDFPESYEIYKMKKYSYNGIEQPNRNRLLWDRSLNVDGLKTGHTEEAGYCLVASAVQDKMRLISVVMGTKSEQARMQSSKKLLNWGFRFFRTVSPVSVGKPLHQLRVWYGEREQLNVGISEAVSITIPRSKVKSLKAEFVAAESLEAPIKSGQIVGKLFFRIDGKDVHEVPLVALEDLPEGGMFSQMSDWMTLKMKSLF